MLEVLADEYQMQQEALRELAIIQEKEAKDEKVLQHREALQLAS